MDQILQATGGEASTSILEMLASVNLGHDLKLLAPHGRIFVIGSRGDVTIAPGLFAGMENGTLRTVIGKELPLKPPARTTKFGAGRQRQDRSTSLTDPIVNPFPPRRTAS